jgi:hypothetical protein
MQLIKHRINTTAQLLETPSQYGVELDLRDSNKQLLITHDPYTDGELFEEYIKHYQHQTLIANVKCEGVEQTILNLLKQYHISDYFFLDLSFPALVKLMRSGEKNIAVRFSEYEPIENALALAGKINWVWVDCFTKFPLDLASYDRLKKHFKLCLVSPELQGHAIEAIDEYKIYLEQMPFDAVCTKYPEKWS